jgi:hypothetical protein
MLVLDISSHPPYGICLREVIVKGVVQDKIVDERLSQRIPAVLVVHLTCSTSITSSTSGTSRTSRVYRGVLARHDLCHMIINESSHLISRYVHIS